MPIQGPQVLSKILAPAEIMADKPPFWAIMFNTCREPGEMTRLTFSSMVLPCRMLATLIISR